MKKRKNIIKILTYIMYSDYYAEILNSNHSKIKDVTEENYKLLYDNDPKYKINKAI